MEKFQTSQLVKIVIFLLLFILIPFISTSMRPTYLYFLLNILIIALAAEAGFLTSISGPRDSSNTVIANDAPVLQEPLHHKSWAAVNIISSHEEVVQLEKPAEKPAAEKAAAVGTVNKLRRCPSMPSLFFIGSCDGGDEVEDTEEVGDLSAQELFAKAEDFIGNFYKQLNMQRDRGVMEEDPRGLSQSFLTHGGRSTDYVFYTSS